MFIILYDPAGALSRFAIMLWFYARFGRWPQNMHTPGRYGRDLWFIRFVTPEEYNALPRPPTPPGDNPYRDPPIGKGSALFEEIMKYRPKLPLLLRVAATWVRRAGYRIAVALRG